MEEITIKMPLWFWYVATGFFLIQIIMQLVVMHYERQIATLKFKRKIIEQIATELGVTLPEPKGAWDVNSK